jgi:hypothetical protein
MMNRARNSSQPQESIFKGVLLTYFVLFCHVVLAIGLGILMFFFGGVVAYLPWILALGGGLIVGSGYLWWKYMKKRGKKLADILKDPALQGRTIEVSLLGGFASVKFGHSHDALTIAQVDSETPKQLQGPGVDRSEHLANLGRLLKQDLITIDEFLEAKKDLMAQ